MVGLTPPRSGKRRPMGVYAPPHLREEQLGDARNQDNGTKIDEGIAVPKESSELGNHKSESSRRNSKQLEPCGPGRSIEQGANGEALDLCNYGRVKDGWRNSLSDLEAAPEGMFPLTSRRFERESASEDWLHWLERLISSAHIQMDAVVALYLDGLLRMETGEGPEEKRAGLTEFVNAMLPVGSEPESRQQALRLSPQREEADREKLARGQKITWLVDNVSGAWQEWGAESSKQQESGVLGEKEETIQDFETWLNARMWALGLDPEVCVPYVTGLLELDEGGSAISDFLADAALQDATATLDFDPVGTTEEILARYRQQSLIGQADRSPDRLKDGVARVENGSQKTKRKAKKKAPPVDLFSHWWSSELGLDWGTTASDEDRESRFEGGAWSRSSWGELDDAEAAVSRQAAEDWTFEDVAFRNERSRSSRGVSKGLSGSDRSGEARHKLEVQAPSGARYQGSAGKPPTSVIVARRMILHVLGLKDPDRRKH